MSYAQLDKGLSLFEAARAMGVTVATEVDPQDKFTNVNGLRFHYLDWGTQGKEPMLLLHGGAQQAHMWDFFALAFHPDYHILALDQRGHGDSQWAPDGDYSRDAHQRDIEAFVDTTTPLNQKPFVLMGLSMGGGNAYTYAARHPDRVKALVIVDIGPEAGRSGRRTIRNFIESEDALDSPEAFVERTIRYTPGRPVEQIWGSIKHNLMQLPDGKWTWKYDKALRDPSRRRTTGARDRKAAWKLVSQIASPTLLVRGGNSDILSEDAAERMVQVIPNCRKVTIPNAGHRVPGDQPAAFEAAVKKFLQEL